MQWVFDRASSRLTLVSIAAIYVVGLIGWTYVMGWGRVPLDFHDWAGINLPRLLFLQNSLQAGEWPLHMQGGAALHGVTDRFLSLPDVITSPQTLLLLVMRVEHFIVIDVLIHYSLGFWGLLLLRRHFQWSLFAFTWVFVLVMFNGHILAHYSVGHFTWGSYFLFPFILLFILRFLDGDQSWRLIGWFALTMAYMVLAGGQHHMTWVLLLLALLVPFCWRRSWWLLAAAVASGLLSAVRLLPPALELSSFRSAGLVSDVIGFPSLTHVLVAMTVLRREVSAFNIALPGNIWFFDNAFYEFTAFVGLAGMVFLIAGTYYWLRESSRQYPQLVVPIFALIALSLGSTYRLVRLTGVPLLEGERYTARLFSLPLVMLIVLSATAIDRVLRRASIEPWQRLVALIALAYAALDIAAATRLWRVAVSSGMFGPDPFDPAWTLAVHRDDPAYVATALAGLAITATTAVVLAVMAKRQATVSR